MDNTKKLGCIIMASGESKRFGTNKLLADFKGNPLFTYIIDSTDIPLLDIVIVTRYKQIDEYAKKNNIKSVLHNLPNKSDTIKIGLSSLNAYDQIMFCTADQPLLSRESVERLIEKSLKNPNSICRLCYENAIGSPVVFPKLCFEELKNLNANESGNIVIQNHKNIVLLQNALFKEELIDIDTEKDFLLLSSI